MKEDYEKPGRDQNRYFIINYFYYVVFKCRILEMNEKGDSAVKGIHYELFQSASLLEKYLLFVAYFLFDGSFQEYDEGISWALSDIASWAESVKIGGENICELPLGIHNGYKERYVRFLFGYLEELGVAYIKNVEEDKNELEKEKWWVEIAPLFQLFFDVYRQVLRYPESEEVEELTDFLFGDYIKNISAGLFTGNILKIFEEPDKKDYSNQKIELEITVRYGDCIRCVCMNLSDTLYDLHWMIQKVFEFDNDHLFAFYVGHGMMRETYTIEEAVTSVLYH